MRLPRKGGDRRSSAPRAQVDKIHLIAADFLPDRKFFPTISSTWRNRQRNFRPRPFRLSHNRPIALTGTWCAPGIREGGGAGPVAWRKRGWKLSSEARARFAAPPHRQRPPRGPRRSGKTTGGALGRRQLFTLRGADPAPRFPTAPDWECSLTMARPETGRGNEEACLPPVGSESDGK